MSNARFRQSHMPDGLCGVEAEAIELFLKRDAGLKAFAEMPHDGTADTIAAAAALPLGYVSRASLNVTASKSRHFSLVAAYATYEFHYEVAGCVVQRADALDHLRSLITSSADPAEHPRPSSAHAKGRLL